MQMTIRHINNENYKYYLMKKLFIIIMTMMVLASCEDFLSPEQINLTYNEVFWTSQSDAEKAVGGLYSLFRGVMLNNQWYDRGDVTTGFFNRGWNGGSSNQLYIPGDFFNVSGTNKSWGALEGYADWGSYYKVVAQSNLVIKYLEKMPEVKFNDGIKDKLLGEAHFMRALVYFYIARIWGNAPLITEAIESSDQVLNPDKTLVEMARSTDMELLNQVFADVNVAVELLDYGIPGTPQWGFQANKGSAQALLGHANLWMAFLAEREGKDNDPYIQNAVAALEDVVNNGNYSLESYNNREQVVRMFSEASSETIFSLNVSSDQGESYRVDFGGIANLTSKIVPLDGDVTKDRASSINFIPYSKKSFIYPDFLSDKRTQFFFEVWQSSYETAFSDVNPEAQNRDSVTYLIKFSSMTVDPARKWNEYQAYFSEADIPVFRFSGIKLLLAEAYVKNGQEGLALPIVNDIRNRAGLDSYAGEDLMREILQQRISELIGEGHIFYDFVRNNFYDFVQAMTPDRIAQQGYYWPVSSSILTSNKLINQTPYWNGKTVW